MRRRLAPDLGGEGRRGLGHGIHPRCNQTQAHACTHTSAPEYAHECAHKYAHTPVHHTAHAAQPGVHIKHVGTPARVPGSVRAHAQCA